MNQAQAKHQETATPQQQISQGTAAASKVDMHCVLRCVPFKGRKVECVANQSQL